MLPWLRISVFVLIVALCLVGVCATPLSAQDLGGSVMRDYPVSLTLPRKRFEASLDYRFTNGITDDLGLSDDGGAGDFDSQAFRLLLNYGLQRRTTLTANLDYRDLDFELDAMTIRSADISIKRNLILRGGGWVPTLALDAGIRFDEASDDEMRLGISTADNTPAPVLIRDPQDFTPYARLTAGQIWGWLYPNVFVEYGHSSIDAEALQGSGNTLDLSRSEDYFKTGVSVLVKFPYTALLHLEYDYLKLFRDDHLDYTDDNHSIKADLCLYLNPSVVLNLGGGWSRYGLNGEIPFLYNEFSQNRFDDHNGYIQAGLTLLFGARPHQ